MEGVSRIRKFVKSNLLTGNMTWTCWDFFYDFSQQASSFVWSTAVCSATFCRDLLLQPLNPYHIISAVTVLLGAAQLEVVSYFLCLA